jgi:transmembrane sensor
MKKSSFWERYARFLSGEHNPTDEKEIHLWLGIDKEKRDMHQDLEHVWKNLKIKGGQWDSQRAWSIVKQKIENKDVVDNNAPMPFADDRRPVPGNMQRFSHRRSARLLGSIGRVAAVMLFFIFSIYAIYYFVGSKYELSNEKQEYDVLIHTGKGQQGSIVDIETKINSNVDTQILRHSNSTRYDWKLKLEGEAYFDIATDKFHSFYVSTRHVTVYVVGTKFNIRDYPEEDFSEVVVVEGRVTINHSDEYANPHNDGVILEASDYARISKDGELIVKRSTPIDIHLAWLNKELVFKDVSLENIARQIERWYNVEVTFDDDEIKERRLTARFENEPLVGVLEVITLALDLKYDIINKKVVFYKVKNGNKNK